LAIGFGLFLRSLILSAARLAIGLIPIYLLVEYVFLEEGKRIIPWSAIARYSTNERKRLIAIETEGPQRISILWCCGQMIGVKRCKPSEILPGEGSPILHRGHDVGSRAMTRRCCSGSW
jgi:hypothetical protein